jgi:hypothetical protein
MPKTPDNVSPSYLVLDQFLMYMQNYSNDTEMTLTIHQKYSDVTRNIPYKCPRTKGLSSSGKSREDVYMNLMTSGTVIPARAG